MYVVVKIIKGCCKHKEGDVVHMPEEKAAQLIELGNAEKYELPTEYVAKEAGGTLIEKEKETFKKDKK